MNKRIALTIGIGLAVLLLVAVFATGAFAQGPSGAFSGMRGGRYGSGGYGQGGFGMTGGGPAAGSCPMWGGATNPTNAEPITLDQAAEAVREYVKSYDNPDLVLAEVMEFERNFYAIVKDQGTGTGAFELLVDRYTGYVHPEPGPNMMWNTQYGHMAGFGGMGMMGGRWNRPDGPMTMTAEQARTAAQAWLDANFPGATLADDATQFSGYYSMDFLVNDTPAGMLSVNRYTGQVWYHNWHGEFISEQDF